MQYLDIEEILESLIKKHHDVEMAEEQLNTMLESDDELRNNYEEWCISRGYNIKRAFKTYCEEYTPQNDGIWDSIFPNEEEYDGYK